MADAKVRDRIVKIKRIYGEPKEMADKGDYKVFSWGIKLEDGSYCNISGTANDLESFKKKVEDKFYIGNEKIKEGETYKVYEESTDEENKYWNVKCFVKADDSENKVISGTNAEEVKSSSYDSYRNGQRIGMIANNSVALAIAENKPTMERIEFWFNTLEVFLREKEK